jgi:hypothetical protein
MRRIKLVLAALVVMVAAFAAFSGPAMAQTFDGIGSGFNTLNGTGSGFNTLNNIGSGFDTLNGTLNGLNGLNTLNGIGSGFIGFGSLGVL